MSDIVEASVMMPISEPKPDGEITNRDSDTKKMVITTADSVESGGLTLESHDITDLTPLVSTAAAELHEKTFEEASQLRSKSSTHPTGATPKKRAAANKHESEQPAKKRYPPKGKNSVIAKHAQGPTNNTIANGNTGGTETAPSKKKRGLTKATAFNVDEVEEVERVASTKRGTSGKKGKHVQAQVTGTEGDSAATSSSTQITSTNVAANTTAVTTRKKNKPRPRVQPRQRTAPENPVAPSRDIPASWDEADAADRMLVTRKENGDSWKVIYKAWEAMTGLDYAGSTLPNRYKRIKVHLMHLKEGDAERLLTARTEVEKKFKSEKYALMATHIEQAGGSQYTALFLQKQLKEMDAKPKPTITHDDTMEIEDEAED